MTVSTVPAPDVIRLGLTSQSPGASVCLRDLDTGRILPCLDVEIGVPGANDGWVEAKVTFLVRNLDVTMEDYVPKGGPGTEPTFSGERQPFVRRGDQFVALDKSRLVRASGGWVQMVNDKPWVFVPSADIVWIPSSPKMREQADG